MEYLFVFFLLIIFYCIDKFKANTTPLYIFSYIAFVLLAGFRYRVGGDSLAYEDFFADLPKINELQHFDFINARYEPLWYVFNAIIKSFSDSFIAFQLVHALIVNGVIFWFINKYSNNRWLSLIYYFLFGFLYFNMEILRESLAVSAFLLSVPYLLKKKWLAYFCLCLVSFYFHSSGVITFLIPFLLINLKTWQYISLYLILFLVFIYFSPNQILSLFNINDSLDRKINVYSSVQITFYGFLLQFVKILPFIGIVYFRKHYKFESNSFARLLNVYIILGIIGCFIVGFYRFQNYLMIISLIFIVDTLVVFKKNRRISAQSYINLILIISLVFINQIYYMTLDTSKYQKGTRFYNRYIPYNSVFDPKIDHDRERLFYNSMNLE